MKVFSSIYIGTLLAALAHSRLADAAAVGNTSDDQRVLMLSSDPTFHFDLLIPLAQATAGGADINPVLGAAKNIKAGDMDSFTQVFLALANETKADAENPENAYDPVNVRDTWFSASQYFRRASFFLTRNWSDPRIDSLWVEQIAAFDKGLAALPIPGERVHIPAPKGNFTVEAIWYAASKSKDANLPTLIVGNGLDGSQEDSYHSYVAAALARGWNAITYEGPGQNTVRREQDIGFIPDWEVVVTPVVDYLLSEKSQAVDEDRIAILGNSMGGYGATRAVAFEPRLAAAVLIDAVWDVYEGYALQLPGSLREVYEAGNTTQFDHELLSLRESGKLSTGAAWGLDYGMWAFNTHSPSDFFTQTKQFAVKDFIDKINVPVFVGAAEYENNYPGQPKKVKEALGNKGTLHHYNGVAGYHCQTGASQEVARTVFAWLNKTLG